MPGAQVGQAKREDAITLLQVLSIGLGLVASPIAFFSWAYAGSDDYDVLAILGVAPWVATWFIIRRRLVAGAIAHLAAPLALIGAAVFRSRWGMESVVVAMVPLGVALFAAALSRSRTPEITSDPPS